MVKKSKLSTFKSAYKKGWSYGRATARRHWAKRRVWSDAELNHFLRNNPESKRSAECERGWREGYCLQLMEAEEQQRASTRKSEASVKEPVPELTAEPTLAIISDDLQERNWLEDLHQIEDQLAELSAFNLDLLGGLKEVEKIVLMPDFSKLIQADPWPPYGAGKEFLEPMETDNELDLYVPYKRTFKLCED